MLIGEAGRLRPEDPEPIHRVTGNPSTTGIFKSEHHSMNDSMNIHFPVKSHDPRQVHDNFSTSFPYPPNF